MKIFSIKNESLNFFNRPIYVESENEALSYIQNVLMSDADRALVGLKDCLSLYYLGEIDFVSGKVIGSSDPCFCCNLSSIFDTIPEDKIPRTEKQIMSIIESLKTEIVNLKGELNANC